MPDRSEKPSNGKRVRFGNGEFRDSAGWTVAKSGALQQFLDIASHMYPDFHTDLTRHGESILQIGRSGSSSGLATQQLEAIVSQWQAKYRVNAHWAYFVANFTVLAVGSAAIAEKPVPDRVLWPTSREIGKYNMVGLSYDAMLFDSSPPLFPVEIVVQVEDYWAIDAEEKTAVRDRMLQRAQQRINEKIAEIESIFIDAGWAESKHLNADRFEWLARFLVGGDSYRLIAKGASPDQYPEATRANVRRGIRDAADYLGITLPND
jgi:hypothetical protein